MTYLRADEQTLGDLRIFGKGGEEAIFQLFNRTHTHGGAAELEDWFHHPMSSVTDINERSELIRYFSVAEVVFPFAARLFEQAELYLANRDERTRLSGVEPGNKIAGLLTGDNAYKIIYNGVVSLLELLRLLREFVQLHRGTTAWQPVADEIDALLKREELQMLPLREEKKLAYATVVTYDNLFRFRHYASIRELLRQIYRLDALIAVAGVAKINGFAFARALPAEEQRLYIGGLYHPLLKNAVPNDLNMPPGNNVIFLTGANMAGKSTFMRSLGVAVYLAHMGLPVPAGSMEFAVRDGLFTTINLPDNLGMGISHFYAEVLRIKKIAQELSKGSNIMVIVDELFRGTNVKDAYEATVALTGTFATKPQSFFVLSTHIVEAGEQLKESHNNISFLYLPTVMKADRPVYTYTLKKGITADRHGMLIINNEGIPALLKEGRGKTGAETVGAASFQTDDQTRSDLNLLGRYKQESVFSLFNKTVTKGGERLLEQLFTTPFGDAASINRRAALLQYFKDNNLSFSFSAVQFEHFDEYMGYSAGRGKPGTAAVMLAWRLEALFLRGETYSSIVGGLRSAIGLLRDCRRFAAQLKGRDLPEAAHALARALESILDDSRLASLPDPDDPQDWPWYRVSAWHYLLVEELNDEMQRLCRVLYEFDVYIAVGAAARENGFRFARALPAEDRIFQVKGLRHPGLAKGIGNSLMLQAERNLLFLTGANMAGKSTLMKSIGIAVYLAHMGFPVAAESMDFSVKQGLYTSINVADNLEMGHSHFYAEVLRVKKVAAAVGEGQNLFVIFDELFKGTNVKDAFDATLSITEAFTGYRNCFFVISTHITEAGELLRQQKRPLHFAFLPTVMEGLRPKYTYRLEEGISTDRHGMLIIRQEHILETITKKTSNQ